MEWRFTIIEADNTETLIGEPIGWDGISISLNRNIVSHGILKSIENTDFKFINDAFQLLRDIYDITGAHSIAFLKIEYQCTDEGFNLLDTFKFDFNTYKRSCGNNCQIEISVNADNCINNLMVRMSQDIDLATTTDIDGNPITPLSETTITLGGQDIVIKNRAETESPFASTLQAQNFSGFGIGYLYHSLNLTNTLLEEIPAFNFSGLQAFSYLCATQRIFDQTDWETTQAPYLSIWERDLENLSLQELCLTPDYAFNLEFDLSGTINITPTMNTLLSGIIINIYRWDGTTATLAGSANILSTTYGLTNGVTTSVPFSYSGSFGPGFSDAQQLFVWFETQYTTPDGDNNDCNAMTFVWNYDSSSYMQMYINTQCPSTNIKGVVLTDVLEFLPTALVGDCYNVVCNDSCMANFVLSNGLKLRRKNDASNLFLSWDNLFNNTNKIFNMGWGISGGDFLIDKAKQFYQQTNTIDLGVVDKVIISNAKEYVFGQVNVGYSKWESEEYNGLDEMNTERKYSRKNSNSDKHLEIVSNFISAGYTIEITRRKSPFSSDWRYDSDIFIINIDGSDAVQGVTDSTNIISPSTRYNYRLTPIRNLLNWFNRLGFYSSPELLFNSGTGNFIASGLMTGQCDLEDVAMAENESITVSDFATSADAEPYFLPIVYEFSIPLTLDTFNNEMLVDIYENIYQFNCNGTDYFGYLISATYQPNQGMAQFKLLHAILP